MNFNNILIGSEDPQRLVDYYTKIFGKPAMADGGYTGWQIGSGFFAVGAHDEVKGKSAHPGRIIWNIETPDVPDRVLEAQGRPVRSSSASRTRSRATRTCGSPRSPTRTTTTSS